MIKMEESQESSYCTVCVRGVQAVITDGYLQ
jgi:hypothetical protein